MPSGDFHIRMRIDGRGILITKLTGAFDVVTWKKCREEAIRRDLAGQDINGRPVVVDVRGLTPPDAGWYAHVRGVGAYADEQAEFHPRVALVVSDDIREMANFFAKAAEGILPKGMIVRLFDDPVDAYAWAAESWASEDWPAAGA